MENKKKVLYLFDALKRGRAETSTLEIASRLKDWESFVISNYKCTELCEDFKKRGISLYSLDMESQLSFISPKNRIQEVLDKERLDLIHSNLFMADHFARFLEKK